MAKSHILSIAFAIVLTLPALAHAAPECVGTDLVSKARAEQPESFAAFEAEAAKVPNAEGLLWRIEGKGTPASYLFGTMHTTEADLAGLNETIRDALSQAKTVAVEIADAKGAASQAAMIAYVTANGVDFSSKGLEGLDETQVAEVKRMLGAAGLPAEIAPMLKPWFLGLTLGVSACELKKMSDGKPTIDEMVETTARAAGAKVVGLETVPEQLDAVSKISDETARRMIRDAVAHKGASDDLQTTTLALYRARRVGWYFAMKKETFGPAFDLSAYADFVEGIVDRRNRLMLERSKPLLSQGAVMIAVGALHLPGADGLVELIRREGFEVTRVW